MLSAAAIPFWIRDWTLVRRFNGGMVAIMAVNMAVKVPAEMLFNIVGRVAISTSSTIATPAAN